MITLKFNNNSFAVALVYAAPNLAFVIPHIFMKTTKIYKEIQDFPPAVLMAQELKMTRGWKLSHYILIITGRVFS